MTRLQLMALIENISPNIKK